MTTFSPNLGLVRLVEGQAQGEAAVNEANNRIDALCQLSVKSRTVAAQPGSPADGDRYLLPPSGCTGAQWSGNDGRIMAYYGGWVTDDVGQGIAVGAGWRLWVEDELSWVIHLGGGDYASAGDTTLASRHRPIGAGRIHVPMANATALATGAPAASVLHAIPFVQGHHGTVDALFINVTGAGAGSSANLGIYESTSIDDPTPAALVDDAGNGSTSSTGLKTYLLATPRRLAPGRLYWLAYLCSSTAPTIRTIPLAACWPVGDLDSGMGSAPGVAWSASQSPGSLPGSFPGGGAWVTAAPVPAVGVRWV